MAAALAIMGAPAVSQEAPLPACPSEIGLPGPSLDPPGDRRVLPSGSVFAYASLPDAPAGSDGAEAMYVLLTVETPWGRTFAARGTDPEVDVPRTVEGDYTVVAGAVYRLPDGTACEAARMAVVTVAPTLVTPVRAIGMVRRTLARIRATGKRERLDLMQEFIESDLLDSRDTELVSAAGNRAKVSWERRLRQLGLAVALVRRYPGNGYYEARVGAAARRFGVATAAYGSVLVRLSRRGG